MARVNLNATIDGFRGAIGEIVFKRCRGKTIATKKPVFTKQPSAAQLAQRQRFREATDYAKLAQADPALRPVYEPVARKRQVAAFTVALRDYLNAPSIKCLYLMSYRGQPGDPIGIYAVDDFGLAELEVSLLTPDGTPVERGQAVELGLHSGHWTYTTTVEVAPGSRLRLEVAGADYAGNRVRVAEEIAVGALGRIDVKANTGTLRAAGELLTQHPRITGDVPEPATAALRSEGADELAVALPLCDASQGPGGPPDLLEAPCIPSISQPAEAIAGPEPREAEEPDVAPVACQTGAGEQEPARGYLPAEVAPLALAGSGHGLSDVPPETLPVPMIWWALLAAVRSVMGERKPLQRAPRSVSAGCRSPVKRRMCPRRQSIQGLL
jgi:hypothetical protein